MNSFSKTNMSSFKSATVRLKNYFREQKRKKAIKRREQKRKKAIERRKEALNNVKIYDAKIKKKKTLEKADPFFSFKYMENIKEYPQTPYDFLCIVFGFFTSLTNRYNGHSNIYLRYYKVETSSWVSGKDDEWSFTIASDKTGVEWINIKQKPEVIIHDKVVIEKQDLYKYELNFSTYNENYFCITTSENEKCNIFSFQWNDDNNVTLKVFENKIVQGSFYFYYTYEYGIMTLTLRVLLPKTFQSAECNLKF